MKRNILIVAFWVMIFLLMACEKEGDVFVAEQDNIEIIRFRWKNETKEVIDEKTINEVTDYLNKADYEEVETDNSKGWIYEITYKDANGDEHKIIIVNEKKLNYDGKSYECDGIDLSYLDAVSGFDREK